MPEQPDCTWLCIRVTLSLKAVESCSNAQKMQQVFKTALEKNFFGWGGRFFVSNVISGGLLGHLGPLCLVIGANRQAVVFC